MYMPHAAIFAVTEANQSGFDDDGDGDGRGDGGGSADRQFFFDTREGMRT